MFFQKVVNIQKAYCQIDFANSITCKDLYTRSNVHCKLKSQGSRALNSASGEIGG